MLLFLFPSGFIPWDQSRTGTGQPKRTTNSAKNNSKTSVSSEPRGIGEFLRAHWISVSVAALVLIAGNGRSDIQLDPVDAAARAE